MTVPFASMKMAHHLHQPTDNSALPLSRRGIDLGWITANQATSNHPSHQQWQQLQAIPLPGTIHRNLPTLEEQIRQAYRCMTSIIEGTPPSQLLTVNPSDSEIQFDLSTISADEHDQQAIEKLYFQGYDNHDEAIGEAWCKVSWLSFHDDDASLRFRFSFGIEGSEDVAANPRQQQLAAALCQQIFPESAAITDNPTLLARLHDIVGLEPINFVERIIYFNAPNGGALFHHDVEPGHVGVIYGQISGSSFWLALSKQQLISEINDFVNQHNIQLSCGDLAAELNRAEHPEIEAIIDHNPQFIHQLVERGFGYILHAGDAILLPQPNEAQCVWHSVFCLGDEPGEGLSFAMRQGELGAQIEQLAADGKLEQLSPLLK
ncbi:MAG: hypothetical protein R8J85_07895 [Mariprofundales bacterium]